MAAYACINDVQTRMSRTLSATEQAACSALLEDAAVIIDSFASAASEDAKKLVSCRMTARALGDGVTVGIPQGATQGSMSGLGYSQSWTIGSGSAGELYLSKLEKQLLQMGNRTGSYSPVQALVPEVEK